ncbi:hypothetical protein [Janibacter indicus]|uniref:Uncharacterized protein n=1 Tax=Janibacter indicus TaxID=857417 RepID=A0A7L9IVA3_9MICO|nr:hypothetical protein [Janibacter indicus]QOK21336.1 hypothetical protein IGS73_09015 [Janibacter indicus]
MPERAAKVPLMLAERPVLETWADEAELRIGVVAASSHPAGAEPVGGTVTPLAQRKDSTLT